jgi:hypothetical protein
MATTLEEVPLHKGDNNPQSTGKPGDSGSTVLTKSKKIALIVIFVVLVVVTLILAISFIVHVSNDPPKSRFIYLHSILLTLSYSAKKVVKLLKILVRLLMKKMPCMSGERTKV